MRINNRRGYTWKAWILLAPFTCGILVPVSRSMDYRHHSTDLIAGALIGILTAWVGYRSYYPVSHGYDRIARSANQACSHLATPRHTSLTLLEFPSKAKRFLYITVHQAKTLLSFRQDQTIHPDNPVGQVHSPQAPMGSVEARMGMGLLTETPISIPLSA